MGNVIHRFRRLTSKGTNKVSPTEDLSRESETDNNTGEVNSSNMDESRQSQSGSDMPKFGNEDKEKVKKQNITQRASSFFRRNSTLTKEIESGTLRNDPEDKTAEQSENKKTLAWFRRKPESATVAENPKRNIHSEITAPSRKYYQIYEPETEISDKTADKTEPKSKGSKKSKKSNYQENPTLTQEQCEINEKPAERTHKKKSLTLFRKKPDSMAVARQNRGPVGNLVELGRTSNANKVIDFALTTIGEMIQYEVREIPLPEGDAEFNRRFMGKSLRGKAKFYRGNVNGLQNLHRVGEAVIFDAAEDGSTTLGFEVELRNAEVKYAFELALNNKETQGDVSGKLQSIRIHFKFKMTEYGDFSVENAEIKNIGLLKVSTSGLGPLNYLASGICAVIGNISKRTLMDTVSSEIDHFKKDANLAILETTTDRQKQDMKTLVQALLEPIPGSSTLGLKLPSAKSIKLPIMKALSKFH